ncbi:MAG TPA: TetR/AcrR family transcriptional regulator [Gammaproteobacteria bacterium]|nr:TetR/AcrR family transcriptional regulator [Gammaproteobacteria bacterium]
MLEIVGVRARNMQKRRARILAEARGLLARGGFEAMNLRELARLADVTVPTIYNLVGNKEEVIVALMSEALAEIEARIGTADKVEPLERAVAVVTASTALFAEDEDFYRPAFLAVEYLEQSGPHHDKVARLYAWGRRFIDEGIAACRDAGLLRGDVRPAVLGDLVFRSYRSHCRAWAGGHCSLAEFARLTLLDIHLALAAAAIEAFRPPLVKRITALSATAAGRASKAAKARRPARRTEEKQR